MAAVAWIAVGRFAPCAVITLQKWFPTGESTERHQSLKCATFHSPLKFFSDPGKELFDHVTGLPLP